VYAKMAPAELEALCTESNKQHVELLTGDRLAEKLKLTTLSLSL